MGINIQKQQRLFGIDGDFFQHRIDAITCNVVGTDKPGIFAIEQAQSFALGLDVAVHSGHIVANRTDIAETWNLNGTSFACDGIGANQHFAIGLAYNVLQHLTLTTTAGTLVHKTGDIVIRTYRLNCRTVCGYPALFLSQGE